MADSTKIQWAHSTVNFFQGCTKVSAGCKFCYMFRQKEGYGQDPTKLVRSKDPTFKMPLKLKEPQRVFVNSWSDFFIDYVDPDTGADVAQQWRDEAWDIMRRCPHLTFIILTKRIQRVAECLPSDWGEAGWPNVWILTSVEDQESALNRIPQLGNFPAAVKGVSIEPLLSDVDLLANLDPGSESPLTLLSYLDWVIVGGESGDVGTKYDPRPFPMDNATTIVKQCRDAGVPVFVKQLGTLEAQRLGMEDSKGGDFDLFPPELQFREFPASSCVSETPAADSFVLRA